MPNDVVKLLIKQRNIYLCCFDIKQCLNFSTSSGKINKYFTLKLIIDIIQAQDKFQAWMVL